MIWHYRIGINLSPVAFERDMQSLIYKTAGRKTIDFHLARFAFELLFGVN